MKLLGSVAVAISPISLYGYETGFFNKVAVDNGISDGVEHDSSLTLDVTELWSVAVAGRKCRAGNGNRLKNVQSVLDCQQRAMDEGKEFVSYKEAESGKKKCLISHKCSFIEDTAWTTYIKPVQFTDGDGPSDGACPCCKQCD